MGLWIHIFQSVKVKLVNQVDSAVEGGGGRTNEHH